MSFPLQHVTLHGSFVSPTWMLLVQTDELFFLINLCLEITKKTRITSFRNFSKDALRYRNKKIVLCNESVVIICGIVLLTSGIKNVR